MKERFPVPPTPPLDEVMEGEIIPPGEFDPMLARRLVETMEMFPAEIQPMIREWAKDSVRAVLNPALDIIQSREGRVADIEDMINLAQSNRKRFLREVFFCVLIQKNVWSMKRFFVPKG